MRPIDSNPQFDPTSGVATSDPANSPAPPVGPVIDQPVQPPDSGAASLKRMERNLESSYLKGTLDNAGARPGGQVLYDKNKKPDGDSGTETAAPVHTAAPLTVADNGGDVNMDVRAAAGHLVGQKVVGDGECYALADAVLRQSGAKSAPDFDKVTKSRDQDYKWGTPIDPKDAKPGDILQFRNHQVIEEKVIKTTKTYPDGRVVKESRKETTPHNRGQHTSVVLANDGDGKMEVAEQHVIDHDTGKLYGTVRRNDLYTKDRTWTKTENKEEKGVQIKIETTTTMKVTDGGKIYAYHPQPKDDKK